MTGPFVDSFHWVKSLVPTRFHISKPRFNFITVHYLYIVGLTIIGSILLYPPTLLPYIDALFFAAGAATQSGLNTVNVNDLYLYQQVVILLVACVANPIFINTFVVFLRLYWFEKRFETIVKDAREERKSRSKAMGTRSHVQMKEDLARVEMGVNGREIKIIREDLQIYGVSGATKNTEKEMKTFTKKNGPEGLDKSVTPSKWPTDSGRESGESSSEDAVADEEFKDAPQTPLVESPEEQLPETQTQSTPHVLGQHPALKREITFADEVGLAPPGPPATGAVGHKRHSSIPNRGPEQKASDYHIAFLEKQRKSKEDSALYIPPPREFEAGNGVRIAHESNEEGDALGRPRTTDSVSGAQSEKEGMRSVDQQSNELNLDDHPVKRGITIDEPERPNRDGTTEDQGESSSHHSLSKIKPLPRHRRVNSQGLSLRDKKGSFGKTFTSLTTARSQDKDLDSLPYLDFNVTVGRNSAFAELTSEQREKLGGIEYRSLKTLAKILICYYVGFHLLGMIVYLPWMVLPNSRQSILDGDGISHVWWGIFTPASMFTDAGFTLTPDSMISFQTATVPLLLGSFLIIIGNTGFPCMLRFVIWTLSFFTRRGSALWEELRFLLDHPRRCFTLLFPSKATWVLFWVLVLLNGIDLIFFIILDLGDTTVTSIGSPAYRWLNGWFQSTSTRTAGFSSVNLANLHPGIQVSYMIMMYISVFPIAISVRRTNVYEEKSLGMWGGEEETAKGEGDETSYVGQHLRRQLSFDLWYIFLGLFIIAIVEGWRLADPADYAFSLFSVLFEIVSAYGTVGLSLGYPSNDSSFSTEFATISKLIIIAMMLRGRHRGLPYALDRAILLPSESLHRKEDEEAQRRATRRSSVFTEPSAEWEEGGLDESGLPKQHLTDPMTAGSGGSRSFSGGLGARDMKSNRRNSTASTHSGRDRDRSLAQVLVTGLRAGPTSRKHD